MIRHVVLFRWKPGTPPVAVDAIASGLAGLPDAIPEIERYEFGPDLGLRDDSWDFALVADFADEQAFRTYSTHPAHVAVIDQHIAPNLDQAIRSQYQL